MAVDVVGPVHDTDLFGQGKSRPLRNERPVLAGEVIPDVAEALQKVVDAEDGAAFFGMLRARDVKTVAGAQHDEAFLRDHRVGDPGGLGQLAVAENDVEGVPVRGRSFLDFEAADPFQGMAQFPGSEGNGLTGHIPHDDDGTDLPGRSGNFDAPGRLFEVVAPKGRRKDQRGRQQISFHLFFSCCDGRFTG